MYEQTRLEQLAQMKSFLKEDLHIPEDDIPHIILGDFNSLSSKEDYPPEVHLLLDTFSNAFL
jgi:endonuclease/exonuclease/phosphatase family metal-dependent hydrolase